MTKTNAAYEKQTHKGMQTFRPSLSLISMDLGPRNFFMGHYSSRMANPLHVEACDPLLQAIERAPATILLTQKPPSHHVSALLPMPSHFYNLNFEIMLCRILLRSSTSHFGKQGI